MASGQVLVVSADERWLRVLEVTLRLAGADTISHHSAREALSSARGGVPAAAIVLDLAQMTSDELEVVRGLLGRSSIPAVVILPEGMTAQRESFAAAGAVVLVRPYRPSELYAALRISDGDGSAPAEPIKATASDTGGPAGVEADPPPWPTG